MHTPVRHARPWPVTLSAILIALMTSWRFGIRPLLDWLDASISLWDFLSDVMTFALWLVVAWGLFTLKRWAWQLALIMLGIVAAITIGAAAFYEHIQPHIPAAAQSSLYVVIVAAGSLAGTAWLLLLLPASRKAFRRSG